VEFLFTCVEAVIVFLWNRAHICNKELDTSVPEWVYVNKRRGEHEITNFLLTKLEISFSDVHNVNPLRNACRREAWNWVAFLVRMYLVFAPPNLIILTEPRISHDPHLSGWLPVSLPLSWFRQLLYQIQRLRQDTTAKIVQK